MAVLQFIKKYLQYFLYGAVGLVTAILLISLSVWASKGKSGEAVVYSALLRAEDYQTEYLMGQPVNTRGLTLNIGTENNPKYIDMEECTVNADFTRAGKAKIQVSYSANELESYLAEIEVNVIFVRAMEIVTYPEHIEATETGVLTDDSFEMYATLATCPETDVFGEVTQTEKGYRIRLTDEMYTVTCTEDATLPNYYSATFRCGNLSESFGFYSTEERSFNVSSTKDVVAYSSDNPDTGCKLVLAVTERDTTYQENCTGSTKGFYIYEDGEGNTEYFDFCYELTETEELFKSENIVSEYYSAGNYGVQIGGITFTADAKIWQSAVVDGMIVEEHGIKAVVNSEDRVLHLTFEAPEDYTGNVPELTIFVTDYLMDPVYGDGGGYSKGIYVYTDAEGNTFKLVFDMTIVMWTYIPISGGHNDPYSDITLGDYIKDPVSGDINSYKRGIFYADVTRYDRGEGFVKETFSAPQEQWLKALVNM